MKPTFRIDLKIYSIQQLNKYVQNTLDRNWIVRDWAFIWDICRCLISCFYSIVLIQFPPKNQLEIGRLRHLSFSLLPPYLPAFHTKEEHFQVEAILKGNKSLCKKVQQSIRAVDMSSTLKKASRWILRSYSTRKSWSHIYLEKSNVEHLILKSVHWSKANNPEISGLTPITKISCPPQFDSTNDRGPKLTSSGYCSCRGVRSMLHIARWTWWIL